MPTADGVAAMQADWAEGRTCSWCQHPAGQHTTSSPHLCGALGFDQSNVSLRHEPVCTCPGMTAEPLAKTPTS